MRRSSGWAYERCREIVRSLRIPLPRVGARKIVVRSHRFASRTTARLRSFPFRIMPLLFRVVIAALLAASLSACGEATSPAVIEPLPGLSDQRWDVHTVNDVPLPAPLNALPTPQYLDSMRIDISASGQWTQTAWVQQFAGETFTGTQVTRERGRWRAFVNGYEFLDSTNTTRFVMPAPLTSEWPLSLRLGTPRGDTRVVLRRTPAPRTVTGRWRASTLNGVALPAVYRTGALSGANTESVVREIVVDSSFVVLHPNARYTQEVYYSEWEVPANGGARRALYQELAVDFGQWSGAGPEGLQLQSRWVPIRRITGVGANDGAALRLLHGIYGGDEPAAFEYRR